MRRVAAAAKSVPAADSRIPRPSGGDKLIRRFSRLGGDNLKHLIVGADWDEFPAAQRRLRGKWQKNRNLRTAAAVLLNNDLPAVLRNDPPAFREAEAQAAACF